MYGEMLSCKTRSPLSYADLQSHTSYQQHTIARRVIEWTEVESVASSKVAYAERPRSDCARADGRRQKQGFYAVQQSLQRFTIAVTAPEGQVDPQCNRWIPATVTETPPPSRPRSYETTDGSHLVRNRRFLVPAKEEPIQQTASSPNVPDYRSSVSERPRRVIKKPKRPIERI